MAHGKRSGLICVSMHLLSAHERKLTGLARGIRAAIVMPLLFALSFVVIRQPVMAGFAVFGAFAHLVMVDYNVDAAARSTQAAILTVLGAILIALGTLFSPSLWLAVGGATIAGLLAKYPAAKSAEKNLAALRPALLMAFMLAVAVPTPSGSLSLRLSGWLIAGLVAQAPLRWLWISIRPVTSPGPLDAGDSSLQGGIFVGAAMGIAVLTARVAKLDHAFWVVLGVAPMLTTWRTSPAGIFWRQQAGTLLGFLAGILLVAIAGPNSTWYWVALPLTVFVASYLSTAVGFMAGQAAFTTFAVVLFCILAPSQGHVGVIRLEDIAIGGSISLIASLIQRFAPLPKTAISAHGPRRCAQ